jgi:hypothetical protein
MTTQNLTLLVALSSGTKAPSRLTAAQAVALAQAGHVSLADGRVVVTKKGERAVARAAKKIRQERVNFAVAAFLADFMEPGVGYSVKPQGKSPLRSVLPWLQSRTDITRDECLNALRALRDAGRLETNTGEVKNNCQIRWFLSGTREETAAEAS